MPTNRPFEAAFRSVAAEVAALPEEARHQVTLLVVDDCPPQVSRANRQAAEAAAAAGGVRVHVLGVDGWRRLAHDVLATAALPPAEHTLVRHALCKPTGSYGAGPNKAALVAAYVGAHTLHRRDSDQITQVDPASGASPCASKQNCWTGAPRPAARARTASARPSPAGPPATAGTCCTAPRSTSTASTP